MNPEEIRQLTNFAEAGLGCRVAEKILAIPPAERGQVFSQMMKLNDADTKANEAVPVLNLYADDRLTVVGRNPQSSWDISRKNIFWASHPEDTVMPTLSGIAQLPEFDMDAESDAGSYELNCKNDFRK